LLSIGRSFVIIAFILLQFSFSARRQIRLRRQNLRRTRRGQSLDGMLGKIKQGGTMLMLGQ
jgi:hypothetical protein